MLKYQVWLKGVGIAVGMRFRTDTAVTTAPLSRRDLLRGRARPGTPPLRPPWAVSEAELIHACDRCGDCIRQCPEGVIVLGDGGFPVVRLADAGCTLCGDCVTACRGKALRGDPQRDRPWAQVVAIGAGCLAYAGVICRSCGEACDERAIRFRPRVGGAAAPELSAEACTGCGMCLSRCPVQAISLMRDTAPPVAKADRKFAVEDSL